MSLDQLHSALELKTVDYGARTIAGHAAAWALDRVGDVIDQGAFTKTLSEKAPSDVAVFIGHDMSALPVGIPVTLKVDGRGLYTETKVFDGPAGDNLLAVAKGLLAHGQTLGLSIGYRVRASSPDRVNGKMVRRLTDIDLIEFSYAARQSIANPAALVTGVKAPGAGGGMKPKVDKRGDKFHVVGSDGVSMGSYDTEAAAQAACDMHGTGKGGKTWDAAYINDLPDSAFLAVEAGGRVDDEGKTVPRSLRHFPVRDDDDQIDATQVKMALDGIPKASGWLDSQERPRLLARARTLLDGGEDWKTGAPLDIRGFAYRLLDLSDALAAEHKAMTLLGESTKDGHRIRSEMRVKLATVRDDLTKAIEWSELIDKGEDGLARLALLARELDLLEV